MVSALLLGFLHDVSTGARVALFFFSAPLAIAVNVIRVAGTAILADYNPALAVGFYHSFSGWAVFVVGFAAIWGCSVLLRRFAC
jgi:exosortase/archaeosortase family protein